MMQAKCKQVLLELKKLEQSKTQSPFVFNLQSRMTDMEVLEPTDQADLEDFNKIFTSETKQFLGSLIKEFSSEVDQLQRERKATKLRLKNSAELPTFRNSECRQDRSWKIADLPSRLRRLDNLISFNCQTRPDTIFILLSLL